MSRPNLSHSGFPEIGIKIGWLSEGRICSVDRRARARAPLRSSYFGSRVPGELR